jgi:hypothetical protein
MEYEFNRRCIGENVEIIEQLVSLMLKKGSGFICIDLCCNFVNQRLTRGEICFDTCLSRLRYEDRCNSSALQVAGRSTQNALSGLTFRADFSKGSRYALYVFAIG